VANALAYYDTATITARSLPIECSPIRGSTLVGSVLACKCLTRVDVTYSGKRSNLLR
jgi:hypothetical protein